MKELQESLTRIVNGVLDLIQAEQVEGSQFSKLGSPELIVMVSANITANLAIRLISPENSLEDADTEVGKLMYMIAMAVRGMVEEALKLRKDIKPTEMEVH